MCGRFVSAASPEDLASYFGATLPELHLPPSYNVAPTDAIYGVIGTASAPALTTFRWGLLPFWAKDKKGASKMINARSETLQQKAAFAKLFATRRCILPLDGFYEWKTLAPVSAGAKPKKQPYYIERRDGECMAVAGIWSAWHDRVGTSGERIETASILTTSANETMRPIHDRMPVLLPLSAWKLWLDPTVTDTGRLQQFLVPAPVELLTVRPVSADVNSVRNNGAGLVDPLPVDSGTAGSEPVTK
jgi:putative SOS response-associated peptidase YedK